MKKLTFRSGVLLAIALLGVLCPAEQLHARKTRAHYWGEPVEPDAGSWKTWAISSGKDYRLPPPPDARTTRAELASLRYLVADADPAIAASVSYWSAGAPAYQWMQLITNRIRSGKPVTAYSFRLYTYVAMAMYDATIAAWESKYAYRRPRPGDLNPGFSLRLATPQSPSYPSEHAATAAAAAGVLSYFFPAEASSFQSMAEEAGKSQVYAGLAFPSDYDAGMKLGQQVAERVIQVAGQDGSSVPWSGTVPTGSCFWLGTNPGNAAAANWKPFLLSSPAEFRPPVPPTCDSAELQADLAVVRNFPRSPAAFSTNERAFYWQSLEGLNFWPYVYTDKWMLEEGWDKNPPRAARAYALIAISFFDSFIASQDGKFAYWYIRPPQLDPTITPIFPTPNFPSYPSNHSTFSATRSQIVAYLFPQHADEILAIGKQAGDSRIWAGIHYQMDNIAGVTLGTAVAQKFIAWANEDGSQ